MLFKMTKLKANNDFVNKYCQVFSVTDTPPTIISRLGTDAFMKSTLQYVKKGNVSCASPIGIDVPVLVYPDNALQRNTIVVVGQDPLRENNSNNNGKILWGYPFAIDCTKGIPQQCDVYKEIFCSLLKDYNLYLTDASKVWKKPGCNFFRNRDNAKQLLHEIQWLQNEIGCQHNIILLSMGRKAEKCICRMEIISQTSYPHITILHPSIRNWHNWKKVYKGRCKGKLDKDVICKIAIEQIENQLKALQKSN